MAIVIVVMKVFQDEETSFDLQNLRNVLLYILSPAHRLFSCLLTLEFKIIPSPVVWALFGIVGLLNN